jgi:hypothetical protein
VKTALVLLGAVLFASPALAEDASEPAPKHGLPFTVHAAAFFGDGLRFNDPYRLATVLGASAEEVSRTASYVDLAASITFGDPRKFQPGFSLHVSLGLEGVQQTVVSPSFVLYRRFRDLAAYARAGTPIVATPETTWGLEGALGGIWFVRGGVGLVAEIVGDLFYGAGTREVSAAAYPVLSGQIGVTIAWEVVP